MAKRKKEAYPEIRSHQLWKWVQSWHVGRSPYYIAFASVLGFIGLLAEVCSGLTSSILAYMSRAMSWSVARLLYYGTTVAVTGGVGINAWLVGDFVMDLWTCTLQAYVNRSRYVSQSVSCTVRLWVVFLIDSYVLWLAWGSKQVHFCRNPFFYLDLLVVNYVSQIFKPFFHLDSIQKAFHDLVFKEYDTRMVHAGASIILFATVPTLWSSATDLCTASCFA